MIQTLIDKRDAVTNVFGIITAAGTAYNTYSQAQTPDGHIDILQLLLGITVSIVSYLTGKGSKETKF